MSFTNKNGSLKSKVYESLTRASRRRETNAWKNPGVLLYAAIDRELIEAGYRQGVYDTLKKLTELEDKAWEHHNTVYLALAEDWEWDEEPIR